KGGPDLSPDVLQLSSSIHRRRPDAAAPFLSAVLPLDGKKNGGPDLRPYVLQPSSPVYRRRPNVAAPLVPAVLTLDGVEKSGGPDSRTFVTTCNCQRQICLTRSEHVLICEKTCFLPVSPASEVGVPLEGLRLHF
ncbi:MAG: hypothetical protein ABJQ14_08865, partial [Hyphomicrobiales bacterium]